jgi:hypothetical protein
LSKTLFNASNNLNYYYLCVWIKKKKLKEVWKTKHRMLKVIKVLQAIIVHTITVMMSICINKIQAKQTSINRAIVVKSIVIFLTIRKKNIQARKTNTHPHIFRCRQEVNLLTIKIKALVSNSPNIICKGKLWWVKDPLKI